ncbi:MAG: orotate phosphoribosyltransferase [Magnetococcales bacterium]|nr:orotate phosphoribosyltransferase [Magnetococcales bacterium]
MPDSSGRHFIRFALQHRVLRFGQFTTKYGRQSPYFFNAGLFNSGEPLTQLGRFYADTLVGSDLNFDMLFGPAYKGIPLVTTTAIALATQHQRDIPLAFNRKESKDHGEGGHVIGAPLRGKVLIIDDVISAGTSVRESVDIILAAGATPSGVMIALDRQERGTGTLGATDEVRQSFNLPVVAIATLDDLMAVLAEQPDPSGHYQAIQDYRSHYGA